MNTMLLFTLYCYAGWRQGEEGVAGVLKLLNEELVEAMQLMGCASLSDIKAAMVAHETCYFAKL